MEPTWKLDESQATRLRKEVVYEDPARTVSVPTLVRLEGTNRTACWNTKQQCGEEICRNNGIVVLCLDGTIVLEQEP